MNDKEISLFAVHMVHAIDKPLMEVLHTEDPKSGNVFIGQGKVVEAAEKAVAEWLGFGNVLALNSGTAALQLALRLAGVGYVNGGSVDDEVITTPMTCTATNMPILAAGAKIVWSDVLGESGLIDPRDVERKITRNTRAIMAVHWGGTPCDLEALNRVADKYGLVLIEDAAHAFGATHNGRKIGNNTADFTIFSFQAIKHITAVDGGVLVVRATENYKRGKLIRWYGIDREGDRKDFRCEEDIPEWGLKWHMNDVNASILLAQLPYADSVIKAHKKNAEYLNQKLYPDAVRAFNAQQLADSSFWLFTILCFNKAERLEFMRYMKENGVSVSQVHARNDTHTCFAPFQRGPLPGVEEFIDRMVCIPVHWKLNEPELERITETVNAFWRPQYMQVDA